MPREGEGCRDAKVSSNPAWCFTLASQVCVGTLVAIIGMGDVLDHKREAMWSLKLEIGLESVCLVLSVGLQKSLN